VTLRVQDIGLLDHTDHDGLTSPSPKDIELREKSAHDHSEDEHSAIWGTLFRSKYNVGAVGALPDDVWAKAYKHAIVRDPVQRHISAWVNKLSCGLYSVPPGQDGGLDTDRKAQSSYSSVVDFQQNMYVNEMSMSTGEKPVTQHYTVPCGIAGEAESERTACQQGANYTTAVCKSFSLKQVPHNVHNVLSPGHSASPVLLCTSRTTHFAPFTHGASL
jgi:hypothetical protein